MVNGCHYLLYFEPHHLATTANTETLSSVILWVFLNMNPISYHQTKLRGTLTWKFTPLLLSSIPSTWLSNGFQLSSDLLITRRVYISLGVLLLTTKLLEQTPPTGKYLSATRMTVTNTQHTEEPPIMTSPGKQQDHTCTFLTTIRGGPLSVSD